MEEKGLACDIPSVSREIGLIKSSSLLTLAFRFAAQSTGVSPNCGCEIRRLIMK